jgi:hypothetical protein
MCPFIPQGNFIDKSRFSKLRAWETKITRPVKLKTKHYTILLVLFSLIFTFDK